MNAKVEFKIVKQEKIPIYHSNMDNISTHLTKGRKMTEKKQKTRPQKVYKDKDIHFIRYMVDALKYIADDPNLVKGRLPAPIYLDEDRDKSLSA